MNNDFLLAKELLATNGKIIGSAFGNSMNPLLRSSKDNAVILPLTKELKVNDVVLYKAEHTNELILHRILKITPDGLIIRGDNLYYKEININFEDIVGVLGGFYRGGKYYDCKKSFAYKLYIIYIRLSYPIRRLFHKFASFIKIVKRKIKKQS